MTRSIEPKRQFGDAWRPGGVPIWARGRIARLGWGFVDYALIAWWGLVGARVTEDRPLEISQAVILREGKDGMQEVLLSIRRDLFGWELPGGTVEPGEAPSDALCREVLEETGLRVEILAHVGDWIREGFRPHTAHVYTCRVIDGELTPSHETPRLGWFDASAPPEGLFAWYEAPLAGALARGPSSEHREWQGLRSILAALRIDLGFRWRGLPDSNACGATRERPAPADDDGTTSH